MLQTHYGQMKSSRFHLIMILLHKVLQQHHFSKKKALSRWNLISNQMMKQQFIEVKMTQNKDRNLNEYIKLN